MYWDVIDVKVIAPLTLHVQFQDGTFGTVIFKPERLYGVFEKLKDPITKFFLPTGYHDINNKIDKDKK